MMAQPIVPTTHPWVELPIQHPPFCLALSGRENHLVLSGKIVMFHVPVATMMLQEGNQITLHAPVGRILRIEIFEGSEPRALITLPSRLEHFCHQQTASIFSIQPKLFGVTMSNGFTKTS
jgi:hypothetical protein